MSWWKYKPMFELKWKQPRAVSKLMAVSESRTGRRGRTTAVALAWVFFFGGLWLIAPKDFHTVRGIAGMIASSLVVALLAVYLPHLANQWFSREVGIWEKAIVLMLPRGAKSSTYHQISEVRFVQDTVAGERFWIMVLRFKFMPPVGLGVAKNVDVEALAERLRSHGISKVMLEGELQLNKHGSDKDNG